MKKLITALFIIIMFTGCANLPPQTPFFGGFVDTTPPQLAAIHNDILDRLVKTPGTESFEYTLLDDNAIAGRVNPDGTKAWCSNYVAAVQEELFKAGYKWDRVKVVYCSIYKKKQPDHVVVLVDDTWFMDSAKLFVMERKDYAKKWTGGSGPGLKITQMIPPYIWWACTDGKWVVAAN